MGGPAAIAGFRCVTRRALDDRLVQPALGFEIVEQQLLVDAGPSGDAVHAGARVPVRGEFGARSVRDEPA